MGSNAIITAGASGIGFVVASTLIKAGYNVAICDVDCKALESAKTALDLSLALECDVTDPKSMRSFVDMAVEKMGGLDTVVANAGIGGPTALLEDVDPIEWQATLSVNLDGQFNLLRAAIPHMKQNCEGAVVLMSSVAGRLGYPMRAPYAVAKWGVIGLKETLAMELGPHGINVNAILPGSAKGDRMDRILADKSSATGMSIKEVYEAEVSNVSMHKMVDAEEIADVVAFLASPAGRSISGQSIGICGNYETLR